MDDTLSSDGTIEIRLSNAEVESIGELNKQLATIGQKRQATVASIAVSRGHTDLQFTWDVVDGKDQGAILVLTPATDAEPGKA